MKQFLVVLLAVMTLGILSVTADAQRKCKSGFEYDPDTKKCVLSDGS